MKDDINENIIFLIIAVVGYLYYKYNSPNQVIDRYYKEKSSTKIYSIIFKINNDNKFPLFSNV